MLAGIEPINDESFSLDARLGLRHVPAS